MKRVSIIIPCYNAEAYLAEAIDSALTQSYSNVEVVVVDDGSTDRSLAIAESFLPHIVLIRQSNKGGCGARNQGARASGGEFLQFLDADDVLLPDCVQEKIGYASDPLIIPCSRVALLKSKSGGKISRAWLSDSYNNADLILDGGPQTAGPLHHATTFWSVGGFLEGLPCAQEYDLHLRLALIRGCQFNVIDSVGVLIRTPENSLSRSVGAKWEDAFRMSLFNIMRSGVLDEHHPETKDAFAQKLARVGRGYLRKKKFFEAREIFMNATTLSSRWNDGLYRSRLFNKLVPLIGPSVIEALHERLKESLALLKQRRG